MINDINRNTTSGRGRGSGGGSKQNPSDDPKQDGCQGQAAGGEGTCSLANSENVAIPDVFEMSTKFLISSSFNFKVLMLDDSLTLFQVQVDQISCELPSNLFHLICNIDCRGN